MGLEDSVAVKAKQEKPYKIRFWPDMVLPAVGMATYALRAEKTSDRLKWADIGPDSESRPLINCLGLLCYHAAYCAALGLALHKLYEMLK